MNLDWFQNSWVNNLMMGNAYMFPLSEILHFIGLCLLVGALTVVDLRLLGMARGISLLAIEKFVRWALIGFVMNLVTGIAFFFADPYRYFPNLSFRIKVVLIILAGINLMWYKFSVSKKLHQLGDQYQAGTVAKVTAALSLLLWVGIIFFGRMIPYLE